MSLEDYRNQDTFKVIGACIEVHNSLGPGLLEIVYKDALEYEFNENKIPYEREKVYSVKYKNTILKHQFYADFVLYNSTILEIKTVDCFNNSHYNQCLNYLKVSDNELALLANFNSASLEYKRIVRTKK